MVGKKWARERERGRVLTTGSLPGITEMVWSGVGLFSGVGPSIGQ